MHVHCMATAQKFASPEPWIYLIAIVTAAFVVAQEMLLIEIVIRPAYNSTLCYFFVLIVI